MQPARSLVMLPASMVSMHTASKFSLKVASSAFPTGAGGQNSTGWERTDKDRERTFPSSPHSPSSLARWARPLVQAKIEAKENRKAREKVVLVYQTFGKTTKKHKVLPTNSSLHSPHQWGWWRSPCPADVAGSDGSPCRGQPPTRWSCRPGRRARWSSFPGCQILKRRNKDATFSPFSLVSRALSFLPLTLCHAVRLDISVVVLAGPNEAALRLQHLGHHVINQTMLVPDALGLKLAPVLSAWQKEMEGKEFMITQCQLHTTNVIT